MSIKNISELLSEYNGVSEDFRRWKTQVNLLRNTYELDEKASRILVVSKLRGKALNWYYSQTEHLSMNIEELLQEMESMFHQLLRRLDLRRNFEKREWKVNESFSDYCHEKLILGNLVPIDDEDIVDYIIEGIPSESLQNQAKIQLFSSVQDLLKAF